MNFSIQPESETIILLFFLTGEQDDKIGCFVGQDMFELVLVWLLLQGLHVPPDQNTVT